MEKSEKSSLNSSDFRSICKSIYYCYPAEFMRRSLRRILAFFPGIMQRVLVRPLLRISSSGAATEENQAFDHPVSFPGVWKVRCPWCARTQTGRFQEDFTSGQGRGESEIIRHSFVRLRCGFCGNRYIHNPLSMGSLKRMWLNRGNHGAVSPLFPVDSPWPLWPPPEQSIKAVQSDKGEITSAMSDVLSAMAGFIGAGRRVRSNPRSMILARMRLLSCPETASLSEGQCEEAERLLLSGTLEDWQQAADGQGLKVFDFDQKTLESSTSKSSALEARLAGPALAGISDRTMEWHDNPVSLMSELAAEIAEGGVICTVALDTANPSFSNAPLFGAGTSVARISDPAAGCRVWNRPWASPNCTDWNSISMAAQGSGCDLVAAGMAVETWEGAPAPGFMALFHRKGRLRKYRPGQRVLIVCGGALGDTLLTVPIARELERIGCRVCLLGKNGRLLLGSPFFERIFTDIDQLTLDMGGRSTAGLSPAPPFPEVIPGFAHVIHLAYELHPGKSLVHGYGLCAGVAVRDQRPEYHFPPGYSFDLKSVFQDSDEKKPYVVIHTQTGDALKSWTREGFAALAEGLKGFGARVVTVGSSTDCIEIPEALNAVGRTSIPQMADLIRGAALLVGFDSLPMHLASAFSVPKVILFGSTIPALVDTDPSNTKAIFSSMPCLGCRMLGLPTQWRQDAKCRIASTAGTSEHTAGQFHPPPCMRAIEWREVLKSCTEMLGSL
ncbi:MAG: hypothetical protein CVV64_01120 [Candidatus Wallbacteria bacterium HGW-Wallbacteria-1]|jgi:hypothetical protein|uniref:Uncharacterized protein n=1 Tax=Candidatus Wallbacteria bacterium HGW-Wallbacteria-1 TaxID=2013854 RepID=A0A2N1PUQ5_9BACT|nr:MAG: hypothetical protein CVV64_01120 [Candidatus Wallbacteria bacterium HGW-Wallbacteria-1]